MFFLQFTLISESIANELPKQKLKSDLEVSSVDRLKEKSLEIQLLKLQIKLTEKFQSNLLATVYWSLGVILGAVGVIIGFGWLFNFKIYERDKLAIKEEVELLVSKLSANNKMFIDSELANLRVKNEDVIKERIEIINNQNINVIENEIGLLQSQFSKSKVSLNGKIDINKQSMDTKFQVLERNHFSFYLEHLENKMKTNKIDSMALTDALKYLEVVAKSKHGEYVEALGVIITRLERGGKFTADEVIRIEDVFSEIPSNNKALIQKIKTLISTSTLM